MRQTSFGRAGTSVAIIGGRRLTSDLQGGCLLYLLMFPRDFPHHQILACPVFAGCVASLLILLWKV